MIGALRKGTDLTALQIDGQSTDNRCSSAGPVNTQAASDDYSFLPQLVEMARRDDGISLPTVGTGAAGDSSPDGGRRGGSESPGKSGTAER